jgi:hypothetical protein
VLLAGCGVRGAFLVARAVGLQDVQGEEEEEAQAAGRRRVRVKKPLDSGLQYQTLYYPPGSTEGMNDKYGTFVTSVYVSCVTSILPIVILQYWYVLVQEGISFAAKKQIFDHCLTVRYLSSATPYQSVDQYKKGSGPNTQQTAILGDK